MLIERGDLLRHEQIELLREVIVALTEHGAVVNELLHVEADGSMTFEVSPP